MAQDWLIRGRLKRVLSGFEAPGPAISIMYPHRRHMSAKVRVFVDFLIEFFGDQDSSDESRNKQRK
jgi:DNA-binding transcriptional LysR family regulator